MVDSNVKQSLGFFSQAWEGFVLSSAFEKVELGITIGGFIITLAAALKAICIAKKIRKKISFIDNVGDINKARYRVDELKRSIRSANWYVLPDLLSDLRYLLIDTRDTYTELSENQTTKIQAFIKHTNDIEAKIVKKLSAGLTNSEHEKAETILRDLSDLLQELSVQIKKGAK